MDRPKEAIERVRQQLATTSGWGRDAHAVLSYLDWLEGKHVVDWPKDATPEWLREQARVCAYDADESRTQIFNELAAIAPERKKRVVNLWESKHSKPIAFPVGEVPEVGTWRCVARNVELED